MVGLLWGCCGGCGGWAGVGGEGGEGRVEGGGDRGKGVVMVALAVKMLPLLLCFSLVFAV